MNPDKFKLVKIHWDDAASNESWVKLKDITDDSTMECVSVGWLVADKPDRLVLVASIDLQDDDEMVSGHVTIPRAQVKSVTELTTKKQRTKKVVPTVAD